MPTTTSRSGVPDPAVRVSRERGPIRQVKACAAVHRAGCQIDIDVGGAPAETNDASSQPGGRRADERSQIGGQALRLSAHDRAQGARWVVDDPVDGTRIQAVRSEYAECREQGGQLWRRGPQPTGDLGEEDAHFGKHASGAHAVGAGTHDPTLAVGGEGTGVVEDDLAGALAAVEGMSRVSSAHRTSTSLWSAPGPPTSQPSVTPRRIVVRTWRSVRIVGAERWTASRSTWRPRRLPVRRGRGRARGGRFRRGVRSADRSWRARLRPRPPAADGWPHDEVGQGVRDVASIDHAEEGVHLKAGAQLFTGARRQGLGPGD